MQEFDPPTSPSFSIKLMTYKRIKLKDGTTRDRHVLIMEQYLGRSLESDEIVHHVDENKKHDDIENLELCLRSIHAKFHGKKDDYFDIGKWTQENSKGYKHGTYSCWKMTGCRCSYCVQAQRYYKKDYRKRTGIH